MRILVSIICLSVCASTTVKAQDRSGQSAHEFDETVSYQSRIKYLLFLPDAYRSAHEKRWPLILYLHGGSLRGNDAEEIRKSGLGLPGLVEKDPSFPFIVVSPLCPKGEYWTDAESLIALLDEVEKKYKVDSDRVYLTGHSMGGRGTWYLAYRHPERFAAIAPLSGLFLNNDWASKLNDIPIWAFQGGKDQFASAADTEALVKKIKKAGNPEVKLTLMPDRDHYILDTYENRHLYSWFLKHHRAHQ